jgi:hypothetical protein
MYGRVATRFICATILLLSWTSGCGPQDAESFKDKVYASVSFEYDQVMDFQALTFSKSYTAGDGLQFGAITTEGVWLTYVICKITNDGPEAKPFTFDLSQISADVGGTKYFAGSAGTPPVPLEYHLYPGDAENWVRQEVQVGGDAEIIPAHQTVYPNYRFEIYVPPVPQGWSRGANVIGGLDMAGPTYVSTFGRPYAPVAGSETDSNGSAPDTVRAAGIPTTCRPPAPSS